MSTHDLIGRTRFIRLLRTPSSERFLLQHDDAECGALDIHYLADRSVQATLVIFEGSAIEEPDVTRLLTHIDEVLLPDVRLDDQNLSFTVVFGRVLGSFAADADAVLAPAVDKP